MGMNGSVNVTVDCSKDVGRTKQQFGKQVDINYIVARYQKTGMIDHLSKATPFYGDVSDIRSYQEALNVVHRAEDLFRSMSAEIRAKFENDPVKMIAFLQDPKNTPEAIRLGMVVAPPEPPKEQPGDAVPSK